MKDFFKYVFASMLGYLLISIILMFLFWGFMAVVISMAESGEEKIPEQAVLKISLNYPVSDRSDVDPFTAIFDLSGLDNQLDLGQILKNIEKAARDEDIKGIYLDLMQAPSGMATLTEIRKALEEFKTSGKFIYAYSNVYTQKAYYLASVADKVFIHPEGFMELKGLQGEVMFISGLLEKIGVNPQIIRHGKYKSAVEPLIMDRMSEANREQTGRYVESLWDKMSGDIAESRGLTVDEINKLADGLDAQFPENALKYHLVDSLIYFDQFLDMLAGHLDVDHVKKNQLVSMGKYKDVYVPTDEKRSRNKIAVVYAEGDIVQGEDVPQSIAGGSMSRLIRSVRLNDDIDAVVLRVNSPGGDGLASDEILREVALCAETKPVVVSMGNLAASGGYYISCKADKIFAQPNTITGSIGVFGVIPEMSELLNDKLGITFDGVKTNENSDYIPVTHPLSEYQRNMIQQEIEGFYKTFITHVAEGRNLTIEYVDSIGQGRVWSGADAIEIGLVDELGGLQDAVAEAAAMANLEDYRVVEYPERKDPFQKLIEEITGESFETRIMERELGEFYPVYHQLKEIKQWSGVQARLPFELIIR
ncbi:MAG: signal peptide peptidase SppA [Bacteroidales bacterium]